MVSSYLISKGVTASFRKKEPFWRLIAFAASPNPPFPLLSSTFLVGFREAAGEASRGSCLAHPAPIAESRARWTGGYFCEHKWLRGPVCECLCACVCACRCMCVCL